MFEGKVALITGASSGIGLSLTKKLLRRGCKVAMVARTASTLHALEKELGPNAAAFPADVCDFEALTALPGRVNDRLGRLDFLVNNAGVNHRGSIAKHSPAKLAEVVTTNLTAAIVLTRAAYPVLREGGSVVQLASIAGMVPVPGEATYSASKAGMRAFARAVADDLADRHIHSGCVCPGPVDTGFFGDLSTVPNIVFSQPMSTADQVADAIITCINDRVPEIAIPAQSGRLATLAYVFPDVATRIRPRLERKGERNKAAFLRKKA